MNLKTKLKAVLVALTFITLTSVVAAKTIFLPEASSDDGYLGSNGLSPKVCMTVPFCGNDGEDD